GSISGELGFTILEDGPCDGLGVADIDVAAGRAGRAKGEAAELQSRRSRFRAPFDEIERKSLSLLITIFFFQHLEPVDDRPRGADQIVANARAQERGEIERIKGNGYGHRGRLR